MKTVNGKNKLERQITKAKKYSGAEIYDATNKYLKVRDAEKDTYIFFGEFKDLDTKYGEKILIEPVNAEKPIWLNKWATINEDNYYDTFVIFRAFNDKMKAECERLNKGQDDLFNLKDLIKQDPYIKNRIQIRKR